MALDRKDLTILAYKERVTSLASEYEEKVANLRVELTIVGDEKDEIIRNQQARITELEESLNQNQEASVVEEEVTAEPTD